MSITLEIPPAKTNKQNAPKKANKPNPQPKKRAALTNQRDVARGTPNTMTKRVRGQYNVETVLSGERGAIYFDRIGMVEVGPLARNFEYYEKFFVHNLELEFVPNQPVTVGGTMYAAPDYDPIDPFPDTLTKLSNSFNYLQKPITSGFRVKMPNFKLTDGNYVRPSLFTGANNNERLVCYGKFFYESSSSLSDGTSLGSWILHYDVTFEIPQPYVSDNMNSVQPIALKCVCDNAGTVAVPSIRTATVNDATLVYNTAHTAGATLNNAYTYSGIIDKLTDVTLETHSGKDVEEGTRVYMKMPDYSIVSDVLTPIIAASSLGYIGELNLSRSFDVATAIRMYRAVDGWIDFSSMLQLT